MSETPSHADALRVASKKVNADYGTAEEVKAVVAQAAATRQAKKAVEAPMAPLIPMTGDVAGIEEAANAEALLLQMDASLGVVDDDRWAKLNATYHVFVKCRNTHKVGRSPHAIYLTEYPRSTSVPYTNWYARRVKEDPKAPYYQLKVLCQACLLDEQTMPLDAARIVSPVGDLEVDPRWLWRRPKDPARAKVEGETRVFGSSLESQNIGRREALARAAKAGFEVYDE